MQRRTWLEEFLLGGFSTSLACLFSNPFEVVKTRMQLQGELQQPGTYQRYYRNVLHAAYTIGRFEGLSGLQKGLGPALAYQFVMNGLRLGTYQTLVNSGLTQDKTHKTSFWRTVMAGAVGGCLAGAVASPLYLVKTHLQSMALKEIAVGHQHQHTGVYGALQKIYAEHGVKGLWRGVNGAVPRLMLGSALQLSTFSSIKDEVRKTGRVNEVWVPVISSLLSSINIVIFMEPLDVIRTRLYNQPVDKQGKGVYYRGFIDALRKVAKTEGLYGFYKGAFAAYLRMTPQAVLGLSFWDAFRREYDKRTKR